MTETSGVEIERVSFGYGTTRVLEDVSNSVQRGEFFAFLGPSGSGKTTLLRLIAGFGLPDSGRILIGGRDATKEPPWARNVGLVFQQFNLWPHMTALGNVIEAPMRVRGLPRAEAVALGEAALEQVRLAEKRDAYPAHLSGGQQQRVAIARALAMQPKAMLFDEATSSLDPELTEEVLAVMRDLAQRGTTMIVVTHEMRFAREVSDEVMFLHDGVIEESGPPGQVFGAPRSERCRQFLSKFIGQAR